MVNTFLEATKTTEKFKPNIVSRPKTTDTTKKRHPRIATPWDAFSSVPGRGIAFGPGTDVSAPGGDAGMAMGDAGAAAGGDGGAACECLGMNARFPECMDILVEKYPENDVVSEIKCLFDRMKSEPDRINEPFYHGADGASALHDSDMVAAMAASCEAALNAFKKQTGMDYYDFRIK